MHPENVKPSLVVALAAFLVACSDTSVLKIEAEGDDPGECSDGADQHLSCKRRRVSFAPADVLVEVREFRALGRSWTEQAGKRCKRCGARRLRSLRERRQMRLVAQEEQVFAEVVVQIEMLLDSQYY